MSSETEEYPTPKSLEEQIVYLRRHLEKSLAKLKESLTENHEDVVVFLGTTKAGKSTLLNALLGNKLIGKKINITSISICKADDKPGPQIGLSAAAETIYPSRWTNSERLGELIFWDNPGFENNRSCIQDILNAFCIVNLFNNVNSAKIVLVVDVNDIFNDRVDSFLSLLTSVENLFTVKLIECFFNIVVVFTKVPIFLNDEEVTVDYIISCVLNERILSNTKLTMSNCAKNFIKHLTENTHQIALFRKAKVGDIPMDIDADAVRAIQSIHGVQREILTTVSPSVALNSQVFLHRARLILTSSDSFMKSEKSVDSACEMLLKCYSDAVKCTKLQTKLLEIFNNMAEYIKEIEKLRFGKTSFLDKIKDLQHFGKFKNATEVNDLLEKIMLVEFVDRILGLKDLKSDLDNKNLCIILEQLLLTGLKEISFKVLMKSGKLEEQLATEIIEENRKISEDKIRSHQEEMDRINREHAMKSGRLFTTVGRILDNCKDYLFSIK